MLYIIIGIIVILISVLAYFIFTGPRFQNWLKPNTPNIANTSSTSSTSSTPIVPAKVQ